MDLTTLIFTLTPLFLSSDDESGAFLIPLILLASGFLFYFYIVSRYRNADKRHSHEHETEATIDNLMVIDAFITQRKGLKNPQMKGTNHLRIDGAQNVNGPTNILDTAQKMISS